MWGKERVKGGAWMGCAAQTRQLMAPSLSWGGGEGGSDHLRSRGRKRDLVFEMPKERCQIGTGSKGLRFRGNVGNRDRKPDQPTLRFYVYRDSPCRSYSGIGHSLPTGHGASRATSSQMLQACPRFSPPPTPTPEERSVHIHLAI